MKNQFGKLFMKMRNDNETNVFSGKYIDFVSYRLGGAWRNRGLIEGHLTGRTSFIRWIGFVTSTESWHRRGLRG